MSANDNRELVARYPFLQYRQLCDDTPIPLDELDSTWLDEISTGWRELTVELCEGIMARLQETGGVDGYRVYEVKSKFGYGRWYDNSGDEVISGLVRDWETRTSTTCEQCGKPATHVLTGWITPVCDGCLAEIRAERPGTEARPVVPVRFVPATGGRTLENGGQDDNSAR